MRKYKTTTTTQTKTWKTCVEMKCDVCGKATNQNNWQKDNFDCTESTVYLCVGESYPDDSGFGNTYEVDICPDCFINKLIPWIESFGGEVKAEEWEY